MSDAEHPFDPADHGDPHPAGGHPIEGAGHEPWPGWSAPDGHENPDVALQFAAAAAEAERSARPDDDHLAAAHDGALSIDPLIDPPVDLLVDPLVQSDPVDDGDVGPPAARDEAG